MLAGRGGIIHPSDDLDRGKPRADCEQPRAIDRKRRRCRVRMGHHE
jgi:hypothetical protein